MLRLFLVIVLLLPVAVSAQDELVIVSPHWEGIRREFERGFSEYQRGKNPERSISIRWLDLGGTSDILRYLKGEFQRHPEGAGVDLFFGGGIDPFTELAKLGLLIPVELPPEILSRIPPSLGGAPLYDEHFRWYASALAGFGILYNKAVLPYAHLPPPQTWEDAARPEAFSWVSSADPRKSGSVHMVYEVILQAYGWERGWQIIYSMGANARGFSSGSSQTPKDVALGESAYGFAIDSYAREAMKTAGSENIGYVIPQNLSAINGDAIAILKGAPHPELAKEFLQFTLSEAGQKLFLYRQGEKGGPQNYTIGKMGVIPDLYREKERLATDLNPFQLVSSFRYDAAIGSARWAILNDLLGAFIIDTHDMLREAQRNLLPKRKMIGVLLPPPISEEELQRILREGLWDDLRFRSMTLQEWGERARDRLIPITGTTSTTMLRWEAVILLTLILLVLVKRSRK